MTSGFRCAIVGAGLMGRWHADAVRRSGVDIAFVVDSDHVRAERLARSLGLPPRTVTTTFADALAPNACDAVHVCTPPRTHVALVRAALHAGRHVVVEKPLADSAAATAELLTLAEDRRVRLVPVHQFLFQRGVERALQALPGLAPVLHMDVRACSAGGERLTIDQRDDLVLEILPHALALAERLLAHSVGDADWSALHSAPGELRLLAQCGPSSLGVMVSLSGRPTRNEATIFCASGTVHLNLFHGYAVIERGATSRVQKVVSPFSFAASTLGTASLNLSRRALHGERAYPGLRELIRRFYESLQRGGPPPVTAVETLSVARARDRVASLLDAARSTQRPDALELHA